MPGLDPGTQAGRERRPASKAWAAKRACATAGSCGAYILDTKNGDLLHWIRFDDVVCELFDAAFLPGVLAPMSVGLGSPEIRTLITLEPNQSASSPAAATGVATVP